MGFTFSRFEEQIQLINLKMKEVGGVGFDLRGSEIRHAKPAGRVFPACIRQALCRTSVHKVPITRAQP